MAAGARLPKRGSGLSARPVAAARAGAAQLAPIGGLDGVADRKGLVARRRDPGRALKPCAIRLKAFEQPGALAFGGLLAQRSQAEDRDLFLPLVPLRAVPGNPLDSSDSATCRKLFMSAG